ncbi:hypothetical protein BGY98DRAFT_1012478 [Russula aff. rugulosa BPL654]|nr:hypothetical protein BGY98DRAFT_1012478 [Russula aff. rugulosa BPL654]
MTSAADDHDLPADSSSNSRYVPSQLWAPPGPPAPANGQPERAQDPHHLDMGYQGTIVDYRPEPITNPVYVFPDVGHAQGIPLKGQPSVPVNQEPFGYVGPGPLQAAFPQPSIHRMPPPNQPNLRRLANRYLDHPGAQIRMVSTEEGIAGGFKVVIILETPDVP